MEERIKHMFDFDLSGSLFSSLVIMFIVAILFIIAGCLARKADPTKPSKGLLMLAEMFVEKIDEWTKRTMGQEWGRYTGYFCALISYLFLAFIWSLTGLPSVMDYMAMPLSLSLILFILIHANAVKYQKWSYFHRYIDPIPAFLPINLVSMWSPLLSTCLRMFGNALSGSIIITLVSWVLENVSGTIFAYLGSAGTIFLAPIPVAVLNLYFGLFSGYIQTLVFVSLSAIWIAQEKPDTDPVMGIESQVIRPANNM